MILHYSIYLMLTLAAVWNLRGSHILYETAKLVDAKQCEAESWIVPRPTASGGQQLEEGSVAGKPFLLDGRQSCYLDTKCITGSLEKRSQNAVVVDMQKLTQVCIRGIRLVSKDEDLAWCLHAEDYTSLVTKWDWKERGRLEGSLIEGSFIFQNSARLIIT